MRRLRLARTTGDTRAHGVNIARTEDERTLPVMDAPDIWTFGPVRENETIYADGTRTPRRSWRVALNGVDVGQLEVHVHRRRGDDGRTDVSYGLTAVVYGPSPGGG